MHQPYTHYYANELPERHRKLVDVRRFGPGERLVFEPYTKDVYDLKCSCGVADRETFSQGSPYRLSQSASSAAILAASLPGSSVLHRVATIR